MIVKTMERPRDLQVDPEITQYTGLEGSMERTGNILLLVRNDYTIFDEMRVTADFKVYADLRLAGVGMIGVVHATKAIDALQRFIGRIELGMIPQVVDTILFIRDGNIGSILKIEQKVKVPEGMTQDDLARPVIVVTDWIGSRPLYEVYSFGEQIVVVPIEEEDSSSAELAREKVKNYLSEHLKTDDIEVKMHGKRRAKVTVPESMRPKLIGRRGSNISEIEKNLGISIDVDTQDDNRKREVYIEAKNKILYLYCGVDNQLVNICVDDMMILQGRTSSKGIIRIKIDSDNGQNIQKAVKSGKK
jgi:ATPase, PilT family